MLKIIRNNFAFSICLNIVVTLFFFIFRNQLLGVGMESFLLFYFIHWLWLILGGTSLFLRLVILWGVPDEFEERVDFISNPRRLLYVFFGITNVWVGLLDIFIYLEGGGHELALLMELALPNLILGTILLTDAILSKKQWNKRQHSIS
jgi:hypothetical protein